MAPTNSLMNYKIIFIFLFSIFCSIASQGKDKYLPVIISGKEAKITLVYDENCRVKERTTDSFDDQEELLLSTNEHFEYTDDGRLAKFISKTVNDDTSISYLESYTYKNDTVFGQRTMSVADQSVDTNSIEIPSQYYINAEKYVYQSKLEMNLEAFVRLDQNINVTYNNDNEMIVYDLTWKENNNESQTIITSKGNKQKVAFGDVTFDPISRFYFLTGSLGAYLMQATTESIYNIGGVIKQKLEVSYKFNKNGYPNSFTMVSYDDDGNQETSTYTIEYKQLKVGKH